jgi:hypothetical protein
MPYFPETGGGRFERLDLVGIGWNWLKLVEIGWNWLDLVGFGWIWLDGRNCRLLMSD